MLRIFFRLHNWLLDSLFFVLIVNFFNRNRKWWTDNRIQHTFLVNCFIQAGINKLAVLRTYLIKCIILTNFRCISVRIQKISDLMIRWYLLSQRRLFFFTLTFNYPYYFFSQLWISFKDSLCNSYKSVLELWFLSIQSLAKKL